MAVTHRTEHSDDICWDVLRAVADCHGIEPSDIDERLGEVVDPDSLAQLWGTGVGEGKVVNGVLAFEYADCRVTLTSDGRIEAKRL